MSFQVIAWLALFVILAGLAFIRPAFGVGLYMLTFFACPVYWWWGRSTIGEYRWNLYAGIVLLLSVLIHGGGRPAQAGNAPETPKVRRIMWLGAAILLNATVVHYVLAPNKLISAISYDILAKNMLLLFLMIAAVRSLPDFRIVLLSILLGAGYIGYEATINHRGKVRSNRLEGIGAPGATTSNQLGNLMVAVVPLTGAYLLSNRRWEKVLAIPVGGFIVNVILLCNSRGCFLAAFGSGIAFLFTVPPKERRKAMMILLMGAAGTFMLMNDPRIVERFMTIFVGEGEARDHSAASRLDYWKAGLRMIIDHPLGGGGNGFNKVYGMAYIRNISGAEFEARSVHNGYINEACEWGIQGGLLRLAFLYATMSLLFDSSRRCSRNGDVMGALLGAAIISGTVGFMLSSIFGSFIDAEWGYWMAALAVCHSRYNADRPPPDEQGGGDSSNQYAESPLNVAPSLRRQLLITPQ